MADSSPTAPSPATASAAIEAAMAKARSLGTSFAIVVVDQGGAPVARRQMAGAASAAVEAGTAKAATAVLFARPTRALARITAAGTQLSPAEGETDGTTAAFSPGGVPLTDEDGRIIGAIGVSGGTPQQNHAVAKAAAAIASPS